MKRTMTDLNTLWKELGDLPTEENTAGEITLAAPFRGFPIGTDVIDVWHWFEAQHPEFSVAQHVGAVTTSYLQ